MENTKNEKQCAIHTSDSTGLICGATIVKPMCEIKPNTDNDGMGFYIDGKCIIKTLGHIANEQMIILSDAIDSAYKLGYSDASVFLMNRK